MFAIKLLVCWHFVKSITIEITSEELCFVHYESHERAVEHDVIDDPDYDVDLRHLGKTGTECHPSATETHTWRSTVLFLTLRCSF